MSSASARLGVLPGGPARMSRTMRTRAQSQPMPVGCADVDVVTSPAPPAERSQPIPVGAVQAAVGLAPMAVWAAGAARTATAGAARTATAGAASTATAATDQMVARSRAVFGMTASSILVGLSFAADSRRDPGPTLFRLPGDSYPAGVFQVLEGITYGLNRPGRIRTPGASLASRARQVPGSCDLAAGSAEIAHRYIWDDKHRIGVSHAAGTGAERGYRGRLPGHAG
jgi:hypothetical protein